MSAPADELDAACVAEVEALHAAFEAWFAGVTPAADFARIDAALDADFVIVGPDGTPRARDELVAMLREAHGSRPDGALRMSVSDADVQRVADDLRLVRYIEHHHGERSTRRRSTAVMRRDDAAPGGVRWLAVHETWLAGHGPG